MNLRTNDNWVKRTVAAPSRLGLTLIELIVVIAIISILLALIIPAIMAARNCATVLACKNNLHQVGVAIHAYAETHRMFPITNGNASWTVSITPFIEQRPIYEAYDHLQPFNATANLPLGSHRLAVLSCPAESELHVPPTNLVAGNVAMNVELAGLRPAEVTDGLSRTGLAVEVTSSQQVPWLAGPSLILGSQDLPHRSVLNVVLADGSVVGIAAAKIDLVLPPLGTPSGGEVIEFAF